MTPVWPKKMPPLSAEQIRIRDEFMKDWLSIMYKDHGFVENLNHKYSIKRDRLPPKCKTLEVGAGTGNHIYYENLDVQEYHALELREERAQIIRDRHPRVKTIIGNVEGTLAIEDSFYDRIVSIHVLEHLPDLPSALKNIKRILKPDGFCDFVIPCECSFVYGLGRKLSAKRIFEKTYGIPYEPIIRSEHINTYQEIMDLLKEMQFKITWKRFLPFPLNIFSINLLMGMRCRVDRPAN